MSDAAIRVDDAGDATPHLDPVLWAGRDPDVRLAHWIAFLLPCLLLGGAWGSQLIGGLVPCEMCLWQRWPHYIALALAFVAFVAGGRYIRRGLIALAAVAIAAAGALGVFHAGVEWHWWTGPTACTAQNAAGLSADAMLQSILNAPIVRCDAAQWRLAGISLAGWNALFSLGGAAVIGWLLMRRRGA